MADRIGIGVVGAGDFAARCMMPALRQQPDVDLVAVYSHSPERAAEFAKTNEIPCHGSSLDVFLDNPEVDAVYVSSRNEMHCQQVLAAAAAGKHVMCEKPLATTVRDASAMVQACRTAGVILATNHHLRASDALIGMRAAVAAGALGELTSASAVHEVLLAPNLRTWRLSDPVAGGPINDIATHDVDALRFVLGAEVVEVVAMTTNRGMAVAGLEDGVAAALRLASGVIATIQAAYTVPFGAIRLDVHGSEASLFGRGVLTAGVASEVWLRSSAGERLLVGSPAGSSYLGTARRFIDAIRKVGEPAATGEDGLRSLIVADALRRSAAEGKAVAVTGQKEGEDG